MFNLSGSEVVFILLAALVVLGPEKLPGAIRQFGRIYSELRRMGHGFQDEIRQAFDEPVRELRETADLARNSVLQPLGDDGPNLADVRPRSISESVRRLLDGDAPTGEVAAAVPPASVDPVLAAEAGALADDPAHDVPGGVTAETAVDAAAEAGLDGALDAAVHLAAEEPAVDPGVGNTAAATAEDGPE